MSGARNLDEGKQVPPRRHERPIGTQQPRLRMLADLPPVNTTRWVHRRKAAVVAAVEAGLLSPQAACLRYKLTMEEYATWKYALTEFGAVGLMTTKQKKKRADWLT